MAHVLIEFRPDPNGNPVDSVFVKFPNYPPMQIGNMGHQYGAAFLATYTWFQLDPDDRELLVEMIRDVKGYKCNIVTPPTPETLRRARFYQEQTQGASPSDDSPRSKPLWVPSEFAR